MSDILSMDLDPNACTVSTCGQVANLLRFLQDHEYRPLGSPRSRTADVRIVAATGSNLLKQVQKKAFRSDLYYRLHVVTLHLPRLCERIEDVPLLANHFLRRHSHNSLRFAQGCLPKLAAYDWPGNIRELEAVIQRGVVMTSSPTLQPKDIELPTANQGSGSRDDSFVNPKAHAKITPHFRRRCILPGGVVKFRNMLDIPALARLAIQAPQHLKSVN